MIGGRQTGLINILIVVFILFIFSKCSYNLDLSSALDSNLNTATAKSYFEPLAPSVYNPVSPYTVQFRGKKAGMSFCDIPIIDCWLKESSKKYAFFILIKKNQLTLTKLSDMFGKHEAETSAEIDGNPQPVSYHWDKPYLLIVEPYRNIFNVKEYSNCDLITFSNMTYKEIISIK